MGLTQTAQQSVEDYLRHLDLVRNCSPNTIKAYGADLSEALAVFGSLAGTAILSLELLTPALLRQWQTQLSQRDIGPQSICRKIAAIKSFCKWLERQGRIPENPALGLHDPRCPKAMPRALSYDQISKLLSAPNLDRPMGCRDSAAFHVLYSAGLRCAELVGLDLDDLNLGEGLAVVRRGKGQKDRLGILGPKAVEAVSRWLPWRSKIARCPAVFVNRYGERIESRSVGRFFKSYANAAQIETKASPHWLRHAMAGHMLANGASLSAIKEVLGHKNLQTTCRYASLAPEELWQ